MGGHTPTPWGLVDATMNHGAYVTSEYGATICDLYAMSEPTSFAVCNGGTSRPVPFSNADANAAFIVHAVNCHADLVAALDACAEHRLLFSVRKKVEAALAKARGETP